MVTAHSVENGVHRKYLHRKDWLQKVRLFLKRKSISWKWVPYKDIQMSQLFLKIKVCHGNEYLIKIYKWVKWVPYKDIQMSPMRNENGGLSCRAGRVAVVNGLWHCLAGRAAWLEKDDTLKDVTIDTDHSSWKWCRYR